MMAKYNNSQLNGMQNKEPLSELGNRDEDYSRRLRIAEPFYDEPKPKQFFFYSSYSPWCREQQEKKRIDISEIS
jgi:hypothetical protein